MPSATSCRIRLASWPKLISCGLASIRWMRRTRSRRRRAPRPADHDDPRRERGAEPERQPRAEHLEQRAARLREPVALHQVLAREHVGHRRRLHREHDADARLHHEHPEDQPARDRDPALGRVVPEREQRATATTTRSTAVATFETDSTRRRSNRSMNTPMNGLMNVRDVEREHHLQQVVGVRHRGDVESLLAAERDRLGDRAADHAVGRHREELHAHQRGEVGVRRPRTSR